MSDLKTARDENLCMMLDLSSKLLTDALAETDIEELHILIACAVELRRAVNESLCVSANLQ